MSAPPPLTTRRLLLRPISIADATQIQATFPQWDVVRHLSSVVPWPYPPDGAVTFIRDHALPAMERGDEWTWVICLKDEPERLIGAISLMRRENDNRGFWLDPRFQRQGLMTEASEAVTDYWFDVLGFPVLRVPKAIANVASRRISEKQQMRLIDRVERDYVEGRSAADLWEITAEEWRQRRSARS